MKPLLYKSKLSFLIVGLAMLFTTTRETPCKLFPKIMGGNLGDTNFNAIDANLVSDILAAGGHTYDIGITGTTTAS
jgi:hypothetical protein